MRSFWDPLGYRILRGGQILHGNRHSRRLGQIKDATCRAATSLATLSGRSRPSRLGGRSRQPCASRPALPLDCRSLARYR